MKKQVERARSRALYLVALALAAVSFGHCVGYYTATDTFRTTALQVDTTSSLGGQVNFHSQPFALYPTSTCAGSGSAAIATAADGSLVCGGPFAAGSAVLGTVNTIAKFTSGSAVGDSLATDDGTAFTYNGAFSTQTNGQTEIPFSSTGVTAPTAALEVDQDGSFDTTAFPIPAWGARIDASVSKSGGTNNLSAFAVELNAQGGDINVALQTDSGDVLLNVAGGQTTVEGPFTASNSTVLGESSAGSKISFASHVLTTDTARTSGNLSSCGGGTPAIATGSTDTSGTITEGTGATGCTLNFSRTYTVVPFCVCSATTNSATPFAVGCAPTATDLVIGNVAASGDKITYWCSTPTGGT